MHRKALAFGVAASRTSQWLYDLTHESAVFGDDLPDCPAQSALS